MQKGRFGRYKPRYKAVTKNPTWWGRVGYGVG